MGISVWPAKGSGSGGSLYWGDAVATLGSLPASGVAVGELRQVIDTEMIYKWSGSAWVVYLDVAEVVLNATLAAHTGNTSNPHATTKAQVGLGNVDNTSDANKPVSTLQAAADSAVQAYAIQRSNHTGTQSAGTITGLAAVATSGLKADVGLGNVDNTSDANKPVSTAQAAADSAALASAQTYTDGRITALLNAAPAALDTLDELAAALGDDPNFATTVSTALGNRLRVDTAAQGLNGTQKTNAKTNIDLQNVDNTSDANKPVSTAQATADSAVQAFAIQRVNHTGTQNISTVSGLPIINVVPNPSAADNTTGWTAATNYSVSRDLANSPLEGVVGTCFAISTSTASSESATSGVYAPSIPVPAPLRNGRLQANLWVNVPDTGAGVWRLSVYNASGVRVNTDRDAGGVWTLPGGFVGQLPFTFMADSSATYTVSFTQTTRSFANTLYVTLISIGNGNVSQTSPGGIFETTTSYVIGATTTAPTPGAGTTYYRNTTRDGSWAIIRYEVRQTVAGTAGSGDYLFPLPTGLTVDYSRIGASGVSTPTSDCGEGSLTANSSNFALKCYALNSGAYANKIYCQLFNDTTPFSVWGAAGSFGNTTVIASFTVRIPISEWAGSVNTAPVPAEEFAASTTGTWDAAASAGNTLYGPNGAPIAGSLSTARNKVVQFQYPIQSDDEITLQFRNDSTGQWVNQENTGFSFVNMAAVAFGAFIGSTTSTTATVTFFRYRSPGPTYNSESGAADWPAGWSWRVRKTRKASLPFANAGKDGSSGLYKAGEAPGLATGATISAGYVGERITWTSAPSTFYTTTTIADWTNATISLTAGRWQIFCNLSVEYQTGNAASNRGYVYVALTNSSNTVIQEMERIAHIKTAAAVTVNLQTCLSMNCIVDISSTTSYKIRARHNDTVGTGAGAVFNEANLRSNFYAVRIA